jgi:hypothetical protein
MLLVEVGREEHCPSQPSLLKLFSLQASEMDRILLATNLSNLQLTRTVTVLKIKENNVESEE